MNHAAQAWNVIAMVWLIPIFLIVHELEEWNILSWYRKHFTDLPASTETSVRIHIFTLCAAAVALTLLAAVSPPGIAALVVVFMSGFVVTNTAQHAVWTFQHRVYAPGLTTGILCTASCVFVNVLWVRRGLIFPPLYLLAAAGIPSVVQTIRLKHRMPPEVRRVHEFFIRIEHLLSGRT